MRLPEKESVLKRSWERLEFRELLAFLAAYAKSDPGKGRSLGLVPSEDPEKISRELGLLRELMDLFDSGLNPPTGFFADFAPSLEIASRGSSLTPKDFLELLRFLELSEVVRKFYRNLGAKFPKLAGLAGRVEDFSGLKSRLDRAIDEHGELKDSASAELSRLRHEFGNLRGQVQKKLERMLGSKELEDTIQDHFYTEREGRFVIPVKNTAQASLPGIVHDASASGATVFIEPLEMVPLNNRLRILEREIASEILKILAALTDEVKNARDSLLIGLDTLSELDLIQAKAELARALSASIPEMLPGLGLKILRARHPLLVLRGKSAIPNDLELEPDSKVLVISGPNTGGKTVLLKTVGLFSLMVRAGMAIPAHPDSRIGLFPEIYAEIGDEQSLSQDLSSYSAHLLDLIAFIQYARPSSLVMVDEILGSTDPEEGSALAIAVLRELRDRGCLTLVTTHLSRLKAFAENESGFKNASFEFDPEHLTPTYHLRVGLPGPSYGIATAQKLGLRPDLITTAEQMLDPESKRIIELVAQLDEKQTELDQRLRKLSADEEEAASRARELDEKGQKLHAKEQELKKELRKRLESELRSVKVRLNQIYEEAKTGSSREKMTSAVKEVSRIREQIDEKYPEPDQGKEIKADEWRVGDIAWVKKLKTSARVIDVDQPGQEATLAIGSIRLHEKLSGLRRIGKKVEKPAPEIRAAPAPEEALQLGPSPSNTLDLRGKRADEAEMELIAYLDRAAREGPSAVYIIHGHGTGVLKNLVREYVASSSYVKSFRPGEQGEGGDGITLAILENMGVGK